MLGTVGSLMASSINERAPYALTSTELAAKVASNPRFMNTRVKVGARVVKGTSRYENAPDKYRDTPGYQGAATPRA